MDERRVADYFVVAGLPDVPLPLEEFSNEAAIKTTYKQDPITDIAVINKSIGEKVPRGYNCLDRTPSGYPADLNHGSIRCSEMYICYRRSRDKPPLTDIGVLYEGKERLMTGCEVVHTTFFGSPANVNNSNNSRIYITYRRASENAASDMLAVVDLCVILENKNETPPHSYNQIGKALNKGLVGSDVYLCYKKAMTKTDVLAFKPDILDRFPLENHVNFPLPESVAMFCLPMGATIECWSAKAQHPLPVFSTFILTNLAAEKVYGAAVTFYEEFPDDKLTDLQMRSLGLKNKHIREQYRIMKTVHYNKSICLLSHWPFFDAFKKFLSYLYKISITGPHTVPIERIISHFMFDVPYPSPQRPRILVQLSHDSLSLSMPEDSPLPQSGASFITMLKNLGPENCMNILLYVLLEHKILIHSLRPAVLTSVAEAVSTMIFPLHWQCPYIPLCPLGLSDVLNAPTPYIIGLDSRYFDLYDPPSDVICIDLDTIRIWPPDDKKNLSHKMLPKKPVKVLQETLHTLFDRLSQETLRTTHHTDTEISLELAPIDQEFKRKSKEILLELTIQEAFLRFMACVMKGYKQFLKPITDEPAWGTMNSGALFDFQAFCKSRDKANAKFYAQLIRTQLFNRFIEERSFVSAKDAELAFFDECAEKVEETKDEPKLIEVETSGKSERTIFILPPEPDGLPEGVKYSYNGFPDLKMELFLQNKMSSVSVPGRGGACPNSPVARRTKQEIRNAQKIAQQNLANPMLWAKCLLSHCYSLWFITLPAYIKTTQSVQKSLNTAYDVLKSMPKAKLKPPDELCYRVMLQLCGQYNQPVLAVKVYWEMKRAGVHPNAITYGYYNKAVLEGKWPSSISRGAVLWRKIRNVIIGVAKFRKAGRRRSLSIHSNSGSEFDQISRTSIDSFLEDHGTEIKHDLIMKSESSADSVMLAERNGKASIEDKNSTGLIRSGTSDRGYNSMTQEEAKNFSEMISAQDKAELDGKLKREVKSSLRFNLPTMKKRKETDLPEELEDSGGKAKVPHHKDHNSEQTFSARLGSIVRRSFGNLGSSGSMLDSSSAGLLMMSDSQDVFSRSLGSSGLTEIMTKHESNRKRHKSAGDHHQTKPRSDSFLSFFNKQRHASDNDPGGMKFSELMEKAKEDDGADEDVPVESAKSDMTIISEEIKDSGVVLNEPDQNGTGSEHDVDESATVTDTSVPSDGQVMTIDASNKARSDSLMSSSSSPLHFVATPVTENDPLGLFIEDGSPTVDASKMNKSPVKNKVSVSASPEKSREKFVDSKPFASFKAKASSEDGTETKEACNKAETEIGKLKIVARSKSTGTGVLSPVDKVQKRLFGIERTNSFPENLGLAGQSNEWPSESSSSSKEQTETEKLIRSSTSLNESGQSESGRNSREFRFLFGHRSGSFRRHKENLTGMLSKATGAVANKLSEIKHSMTPSKLGSSTSLTPSVEGYDSDSGEDISSQRKSGSLDYLRLSNDKLSTPTSVSHRAAQLQESAPNQPSYLDQLERSRDVDRGRAGSQLSGQQVTLVDIALEVEISSCSRCTRCRSMLYDEEIMAGWSADDSNLNTSCPFCSSKVVPHLQVYLKDNRGRKKTKLVEVDGSDDDHSDNKPHRSLSLDKQSYGKDNNLCSDITDEHQLLFGEDHLEGDSHSVKSFDSAHDPWTRQSTHSSSENRDMPARPKADSSANTMTMAEMAYGGLHRRTGSECLTSATDNMFGSSVDSYDSYTFRALRSPLSISIDEQEPLPTQPSANPETKRDFLDSLSFGIGSVDMSDDDIGDVMHDDVFDDDDDDEHGGPSPLEPISVPYLSPLVLRKELENIVVSEGDMALAVDTFVDEHPIIFWNLVWYFKRIQTISHLPGFLLTARCYNKDPEAAKKAGMSSAHVLIRPMWDNVRIHEEPGFPMYKAWTKGQRSTTVDALITEAQPFNRAVMHQIITSIQCNDVLSPIKLVANGRRRFRPRKSRFRSLYREISFLAFVACGRENIDHDAFDREFKMAFSRLAPVEVKRLQRDDRPRHMKIQCCRKVFSELEV